MAGNVGSAYMASYSGGTAARNFTMGQHAYQYEMFNRSSATAEDLPTASFAGQQDTYLNVQGEVRLLDSAYWRKGCSSLGTLRYAALVAVTDRTIGPRVTGTAMYCAAVDSPREK